MWFKQIQLYQLTDSSFYAPEVLTSRLEALAFQPCLPSLYASSGWVPPLAEEHAPLVREISGCIMLCLQTEEKILPATVIRQKLAEKIKEKEVAEDRKIRQKEKLALKDELTITLLPQAFTKLNRLYAYIDTKNHWLVIDTANKKKAEQFITLFRKSISEQAYPFELKKLTPVMTNWLVHQNNPTELAIEKTCVLYDPEQQTRIIRCQQQNLFAQSIQTLIKDGCVAKQLALSWQDRVNFTLSEDFALTSIKFQDEITTQASEMEAETKQQRFDADFLIMTETLNGMLKDLLTVFIDPSQAKADTPISTISA